MHAGDEHAVVMVNYCRARLLPLSKQVRRFETANGRKIDLRTAGEGVNISPYSEVQILRRVSPEQLIEIFGRKALPARWNKSDNSESEKKVTTMNKIEPLNPIPAPAHGIYASASVKDITPDEAAKLMGREPATTEVQTAKTTAKPARKVQMRQMKKDKKNVKSKSAKKAENGKIKPSKAASERRIRGSAAPLTYRGEVTCKSKGAVATGVATPFGLTVHAGSQAVLKEWDGAAKYPSRLKRRKELIEQGLLKKQDGFYVFQQDVAFDSPSTAACVVLGTSANGLISWRSNKDGKTLKELA
jgi:hypothetical protein